MQIEDDAAVHMLIDLRRSDRYDLPLTNRPMADLWHALNGCLLDLRMPLYHRRLNKKPPKPAVFDNAIQRSLVFLAAFADAAKTNQAIVSSQDGWIRSISFQPRPRGMSWTAEHAIDPPELVLSMESEAPETVTIEDMLHLAAKIVYAISGHNAGEMPDATATFTFSRNAARGVNFDSLLQARVVIREINGTVHRAHI